MHGRAAHEHFDVLVVGLGVYGPSSHKAPILRIVEIKTTRAFTAQEAQQLLVRHSQAVLPN